MGTYSDEAPDASVLEKVKNSVKKSVADVARLTAPRSVASIKPRIAEGEHDADTIARMRSSQSTDADNSYQ